MAEKFCLLTSTTRTARKSPHPVQQRITEPLPHHTMPVKEPDELSALWALVMTLNYCRENQLVLLTAL